MVTGLWRIWNELDGGSKLFQFFDRDVADLGQARDIPGTRVDVHQTLQQLQGFVLVLLGIGLDGLVRFGHGRRRCQGCQRKRQGEMSSQWRAEK